MSSGEQLAQRHVELTILFVFADEAKLSDGRLTLGEIRRRVDRTHAGKEFGARQVEVGVEYLTSKGLLIRDVRFLLLKHYKISRSGINFVEENFTFENLNEKEGHFSLVSYETIGGAESVVSAIAAMRDVENISGSSHAGIHLKMNAQADVNWTKWGTIIGAIGLILSVLLTRGS